MDSHTNEKSTTTAKKPMKKYRQRSPSSITSASDKTVDNQPPSSCQYRRSSSLSLSAEFANTTLEAAENDYGSPSMNSNVSPLPTHTAKYRLQEGNGSTSLKSQNNDRGASWRWLRSRKGIRAKRIGSPRARRSTDGTTTRLASIEKPLLTQVLSSEKETVNDSENINAGSSFSFECQVNCKNKSQEKDQCHSSTSLSPKYQPKFFEDVAGHEIIVKALSNAVQKRKIAPLYLFHGPGGTGKTSTARIFSMALNCESTEQGKPCWSCRGCNRSLYMMDLCSGSRISGFERIRTLLQSTAFTQIVTGFKVFVLEECHSLNTEAWDEIQSILERDSGSTVVFVMITEDVTMVPKNVSSRCQKFFFPKLKDMDITLKLARIVSSEVIEIERDALSLITSKADGSMREAENILDQLGLLGSRITTPMVQQIVGLVPHNKLIDLLTTVLSADTIKTVRSTRDLIASGVQPQSILSQLASLIMDILSGASASATSSLAGSSKDTGLSRFGSQLSDSQSERLSNALKMLVDTERNLSTSNDQTNWVVATLLQVASDRSSNRSSGSIVLPRDIIVPSDFKFDNEIKQISTRKHSNEGSEHLHHSRSRKSQHDIDKLLEESHIVTNDSVPLARNSSKTKRQPSGTVRKEATLGQIGNMEDVWQNMLGKIQSPYVKEFLSRQGKIASLTISSANVIVHLMFKRPQDKLAAQMSEETIESALQEAFGCPVTINMSLQPMQMDNDEGSSVLSTKGKENESRHYRQQQVSAPFPAPSESPHIQNAEVVMHHSGSRKSSAASDSLRNTTRIQGDMHTSECQDRRPSVKQEASTTRLQQVVPFSGPLTPGNDAATVEPTNDSSAVEQAPISVTNIKKATNPRHRWLSLSSIQQGDASVETYSQDLLFENENTDREKGKKKHSKLFKGFIKDNNNQHHQNRTRTIILNRSWSCSDSLCPRGTKVMKRMG